MDGMDFIDVSNDVETKDNFMKKIYIALIVLLVLGLVTYFFGYELFKPFIKV